MSNPPFPYTIFTVETSKIGQAYIEDYTPEHQAGLGATAHYISPLANSLLYGNPLLPDVSGDPKKMISDPYKLR